MSFSGRIDSDNYNVFLQESVELLLNAIDVFRMGYFDAAYYLVRSAIEVSTVGVYFSDSHTVEKEEKKKSWIDLSYFPVQKKLLKRLIDEGLAFSEFKEELPAFLDLIEKSSDYANKMIHKQGHQSFYCVRNHPAYVGKYPLRDLTNDFMEYLRTAIGIVAVMRLAIDPFPVLLTDETCRNRFADSVTRPYSDELIDQCIGNDILTQYKQTGFYSSVKQWVISMFPIMSDAAYDAQQVGYIDVECRMDLLADIDLVGFHTACAVFFTLAFPEVCNVYVFGGIDWYFNNRFDTIPASSSTALIAEVEESGVDNFQCTSSRFNAVQNVTDEFTLYRTARKIGSEGFVIETVTPLLKNQIVFLDSIVDELDSLRFKAANLTEWRSGLKLTKVYDVLFGGK